MNVILTRLKYGAVSLPLNLLRCFILSLFFYFYFLHRIFQMTPLDLLRDHTIKKIEIKIEDDKIFFTGAKKGIPKNTITTFTGKTSKKHYDLFAIYTCLVYADCTFGEYVKKCRSEKAAMVSTLDKKELLAYLRGTIAGSAQIQPVPTTSSEPVAKKSTKPEASTEVKTKKRKPEEESKRPTKSKKR